MKNDINVLGGRLAPCSEEPLTGFYRDGCCRTGAEDVGSHTVCCEMTAEFLAFSKAAGNDLSTPAPHFGFPGLKPGDRWCLCAPRWQEALEAGAAPLVVLEATHEGALDYATLDDLKAHAAGRSGGDGSPAPGNGHGGNGHGGNGHATNGHGPKTNGKGQ